MRVNKRINTTINMLRKFNKNHIGIISVLIVSAVVFVSILIMISPVDMNNLGGQHSWLSGSTMKFVNNWLEEGALNLNFTNYENPASIEFENLDDREPYLSYPSGETFFVYLIARLTGKGQISISFLHKLQIVAFAFETLLFSSFIYLFLKRTAKIKNEPIKVFISVLSGMLWILLPVCMYYLSNIYFADQCVILWTMGLTLVEYIIRTNNKENKWLKVLRAIIVYSGVLIDYYFWALVLLFFIAEFIEVFLESEKKERKKKVWDIILWFVLPVALGVFTYFLQLMKTDEWLGYLINKYDIRVGGKDYTFEWIKDAIFNNFERAFSLGEGTIGYLITLIIVGMIGGVIIFIKRKRFSEIIKNPGASVVLSNILAIVLQIFLFKQHSAIHEFSMVKVGWIVAILPVILSLECYVFLKKKRFFMVERGETRGILVLFSLCYLLVFFAVGLPISEENYRLQRINKRDYSFEYMIAENTDYEDVVFSYSKEILANPPQSLAISRKRVYKIKDVSEIEDKMPSSDSAKAIMIINDTELNRETYEQIKCLKKDNEIKVLNEEYYFIKLSKDYEKCRKT